MLCVGSNNWRRTRGNRTRLRRSLLRPEGSPGSVTKSRNLGRFWSLMAARRALRADDAAEARRAFVFRQGAMRQVPRGGWHVEREGGGGEGGGGEGRGRGEGAHGGRMGREEVGSWEGWHDYSPVPSHFGRDAQATPCGCRRRDADADRLRPAPPSEQPPFPRCGPPEASLRASTAPARPPALPPMPRATLPWCRDRPADVIWPSRRIRRMGSSAGVAPSPRRRARSSETGWSLRPTATSS